MLYFEDGKVIAESGDVKVYKMNDTLYLESGPGHNLWIDSTEEFSLRRIVECYEGVYSRVLGESHKREEVFLCGCEY